MTQELFYTSAPRGLKPGSRGFCTVMSTSGMAKNLADRLEALSGYRHVFPPNDPQANLNPVVLSHLRVTVGAKPMHVLSRICAAGLDYTQRSNKFAHHVGLDANERVAAGPAALLAVPGFMESSWQGEPRVLPAGRKVPQVTADSGICQHWQKVTGDSGWGGVLAETASVAGSRVAAIIFRPGTDTLALVAEALSLLPPKLRWQVTFSTYYTKLPPELDCQWRFVLAGSPEAKALERSPNVLAINLCCALGRAPDGPLVEAARTGIVPQTAVTEQELVEPSPVRRPAPYAQPVSAVSPAPVGPTLQVEEFDAFLPDRGPPSHFPPRLQKKVARRPFWLPIIATAATLAILIGAGVYVTLRFIGPSPMQEKVMADAKAIQNQAAEDRTAKDQAAREQATRGQSAQEQAAKDQAYREQEARDQVAREQEARDQAAREQATREQATRDQAAKEQEAMARAAKEQAARDEAAKVQAIKDRAAKAQAGSQPNFPVAVSILQNIQDSQLSDRDNSVVICSVGDDELHDLKIDLVGGKSILDDGWIFTIQKVERSQLLFAIAVGSQMSSIGDRSVARIIHKDGNLWFDWEKNLPSPVKNRAASLSNAILCIHHTGKQQSIALRTSKQIDKLRISLQQIIQPLTFSPTIPRSAKLKLLIPEPQSPWNDYRTRRVSDSSIELKSPRAYMPSFTVKLDTLKKEISTTCDWALDQNSPSAQKELESKMRASLNELESKKAQLTNLKDQEKSMKEKIASLEKQLTEVHTKLDAIERWTALKNTQIPFSVAMEVGDADQPRQWILLAASLGAGLPEPPSTN